jgi:hypothetical protein
MLGELMTKSSNYNFGGELDGRRLPMGMHRYAGRAIENI